MKRSFFVAFHFVFSLLAKVPVFEVSSKQMSIKLIDIAFIHVKATFRFNVVEDMHTYLLYNRV